MENAGELADIQFYFPYWTLEGEHVMLISANSEMVAQITGGKVATQYPVNDEIYKVSNTYPDIYINISNNPCNNANSNLPAQCGPY